MHPCLARSMYDYDCISLLGAQHVWLWLHFLAWRSAYMIMTASLLGAQHIWLWLHPCLTRSMYDYDCISLLGAQHIWLWLMVQDASLLGAQHIWLWLHFSSSQTSFKKKWNSSGMRGRKWMIEPASQSTLNKWVLTNCNEQAYMAQRGRLSQSSSRFMSRHIWRRGTDWVSQVLDSSLQETRH